MGRLIALFLSTALSLAAAATAADSRADRRAAKLSTTIEERQKSLDDLAGAIDDRQRQIARLDIEDAEADRNRFKERLGDLADEIGETRERLAELKTQSDSFRRDNREEERQNAEYYANEIPLAKTGLEEAEAQLAKLQSDATLTNGSLLQDVPAMQRQVETRKAALRDLESRKLAARTASNRALADAAAAFAAQDDELRLRLLDLQGDYRETTAAYDGVVRRLREAYNTRTSLRAAIGPLKAQYAGDEAWIKAARDRLREMRTTK